MRQNAPTPEEILESVPADAATVPGAPVSAASTVRTPWSEFWRKFRKQHVAVIAGEPSPEGKARCHITDPFGNRIELIAL